MLDTQSSLPQQDAHDTRSALTWYIAALGLATYGTLVLFETPVPGVADLFALLEGVDAVHIYLTAFVAILFEGVYVVGTFVPGTSIILLSALVSGIGGIDVLMVTTLVLYVGWLCAGLINIFVAKKLTKTPSTHTPHSSSLYMAVLTCYPSFRAAQEVAEVVRGVRWQSVFVRSAYIKAAALCCFFVGALIVPYVIPTDTISNEEGVFTVYALAVVCVGIGLYHMRGMPVVRATIRRVLPPNRPKRNNAECEQGKAE
jgi:hypothetical protein